MVAIDRPGPVINTTEKEITFKEGVINLPDDFRKRIRELMTFEEVPTQEILIQRAKEIVSCVEDGLEACKEEISEGDPMDRVWSVVITDCPDFLQRRLEDVMMIDLFEPVYVFPGGNLLWLYDNEREWCHRRDSLLPSGTTIQKLLQVSCGAIKEDEMPSYPQL